MKKGYELLFMAPRSQRYHDKPMLDAVIAIAKACNIHRYTRRANTQGVGADGRAHSVHFFELADEPEELLFVLDATDSATLLRAVRAEALHVFCVRRAIAFGHMGDAAQDEDD